MPAKKVPTLKELFAESPLGNKMKTQPEVSPNREHKEDKEESIDKCPLHSLQRDSARSQEKSYSFDKEPVGIALGQRITRYTGLDTFDAPDQVSYVTLTSDEVSALCPVTEQPDWYTVEATYVPDKLCVESKTWKLFLQSFRNKGIFCEALSQEILLELVKFVMPFYASVIITQKPRGGVKIEAKAFYVQSGAEDIAKNCLYK